jgi:hypothetical protein|nr:MAG TPA: hypothetical protein [Caudoviricetes sp.]
MNSKRPDLSCNQTIREAIQKIALRGIVHQGSNSLKGTEKITGYVAKIHKDGDLAGTIDVQEYVQLAVDETEETKMGYHEGVLLSAIQDNSKGLVIIPKMYSEVVVSKDSITGTEYVSMFSHVDVIQLDSHDTITIEVKEREEFDQSDENSPDVDELEETGVMSQTVYTKDSIKTEVHKEKDSHVTVQEINGESYSVNVDDQQTTLEITKDSVHIQRDSSESTISKDKIEDKVGNSSVTVENGCVSLGSTSGTDNAVLGTELATILSDLLQYIGQVMTTTMMGPQPPVNVASFIALKAKIDAFKSTQSGFLTKKVMIQK